MSSVESEREGEAKAATLGRFSRYYFFRCVLFAQWARMQNEHKWEGERGMQSG